MKRRHELKTDEMRPCLRANIGPRRPAFLWGLLWRLQRISGMITIDSWSLFFVSSLHTDDTSNRHYVFLFQFFAGSCRCMNLGPTIVEPVIVGRAGGGVHVGAPCPQGPLPSKVGGTAYSSCISVHRVKLTGERNTALTTLEAREPLATFD